MKNWRKGRDGSWARQWARKIFAALAAPERGESPTRQTDRGRGKFGAAPSRKGARLVGFDPCMGAERGKSRDICSTVLLTIVYWKKWDLIQNTIVNTRAARVARDLPRRKWGEKWEKAINRAVFHRKNHRICRAHTRLELDLEVT